MQLNKNLIQAAWLGIANSSNMIVAILSSAILSRYFDKYEYGTYKQIIFIYTTLLMIFQAGIPSVFSYFLPRYTMSEGKYLVSKLEKFLGLLGIVFSVFLFVFSSIIADILNNPELSIGLKIFSIFPIFTLPTIGVEGIYISLKNTKFIAVYHFFTRFLMLLCIVLPIIIYKSSYIVALCGWGVASFISFLISLWAKKKPYRSYNVKFIPNINKQIFKYSFPIMGSSILMFFFNSVNQFFISRYCGVENFAEFSNGFITLPFVPIIIAPFRQLLIPIFSKASKEGKYSHALNNFQVGIYKMSIIMIPIIFFCFIIAEEIMEFMYGCNYANSAIYFRFFLIFNLFELFPFATILSAIGKTDILFKIDLFSTIMIWLLDCLLVYYGLISSSLFAIIYILFMIMMKFIIPYFFIEIKLKLSMVNILLLKKLAVVFLHTIITSIIFIYIINTIECRNYTLNYIIAYTIIYALILFLLARAFSINYKSIIK